MLQRHHYTCVAGVAVGMLVAVFMAPAGLFPARPGTPGTAADVR